jgi:hypothetical protein
MSNRVLRDGQDPKFSCEALFDPRCGFVLIEAVDLRPGNQRRATEHNLIRVAADGHRRLINSSDSSTLSAWIGSSLMLPHSTCVK